LFAQDLTGHPAEELIASTVRIEGKQSNNKISIGTGFMYDFLFRKIAESRYWSITAIVTNKHVIKDTGTVPRVGFDNGKANPGTSCPTGHSKNYCRGWEHGSGIVGNAGSRLVPDGDSKSSTSDVGGGKGTFKVTVEIFVSPRLSFDQRPPAFSVTINDQQQGTDVHITENDERPKSTKV
jgi:hypothetical protein